MKRIFWNFVWVHVGKSVSPSSNPYSVVVLLCSFLKYVASIQVNGSAHKICTFNSQENNEKHQKKGNGLNQTRQWFFH